MGSNPGTIIYSHKHYVWDNMEKKIQCIQKSSLRERGSRLDWRARLQAERPGFDSLWGHLIFWIYVILPAALQPWN
jgi:hypothetical protein